MYLSYYVKSMYKTIVMFLYIFIIVRAYLILLSYIKIRMIKKSIPNCEIIEGDPRRGLREGDGLRRGGVAWINDLGGDKLFFSV